MGTYVIFQSTTRDTEKLSAYAARALPIVAAHGGRLLGGGPLAVLHDGRSFERATLFEFPDRVAAMAWHDSPDYRALLLLRAEAMDCSVIMVG